MRTRHNGDRHNAIVMEMKLARAEAVVRKATDRSPSAKSREHAEPCYALMGFEPNHPSLRAFGVR